MQPGLSADWFCVIKLKNELPVSAFALALLFQMIFTVGRKFGRLPSLAFVFAKIFWNQRKASRQELPTDACGLYGRRTFPKSRKQSTAL